MHRPLLLAAVALTLAGPALAQADYHPRGLFRAGYSDRQLGPGRWEVRGSSHEEGGSIPVALYHAAEIANAAGVAELRVVRQNVRTQRMVTRAGGTIALAEKTVVEVRAIRGDADRVACAMPEARRCLTLPVAGLLAAYGPRLGMPAARAGEIPAAPVQLTTTRDWPFAGVPAPRSDGGPMVKLFRGLAAPRAIPVSAPARPVPLPAMAYSPSATDPAAGELAAFRPAPRAPLPATRATAAPSYEDRLRAARPVSGDPKLGWTASD